MELIRINGNTEVITSLDCALEVVDKYLGQELARYIQDEYISKLTELQDEIDDMYTEDEALREFHEPKQACIQEAFEAVEELKNKIEDTKRLNHKKIIDTLDTISENLYGEM